MVNIRRGRLLIVSILALLVILLLDNNFLTQASHQAYPPPQNYQTSLNKEIEAYRKMLEGDPDEQSRRSIETKLAMAEREATRRAQEPPTKDPNKTPELIPVTDGPVILGIFEGQGLEIHPSSAVINNRWSGAFEEMYVLVLVGVLTDDPEQGIIYVQRFSADRRLSDWTRYLAPHGTGALRIDSVEGARLILLSESGTILYFDAPGLTFVSSLTEIVPTAAPLQPDETVTPYPPPQNTPYP